MDSQGMKKVSIQRRNPSGKRRRETGPAFGSRLEVAASEICLINTSELGCGTQRGASEGKGLYVGPASLLESLGVPCWVYFLIQEA